MMQLSGEAGAATVALLAGVDMQRFYVHVRETVQGGDDEVDIVGSYPRLVLFAEVDPGEGVNWWFADDDGDLRAGDASDLKVCAGWNCPVEGCTRAESLRKPVVEEAATPASVALDLRPTPLTEGENHAITEYHRDIETEVENLGYFLEREFPEPIKASGAKAILGVTHRLLLELKSRRIEQGLLREHPSDLPTTRIRIWMEQNYPGEWDSRAVFSDWVISKLEAGKATVEAVEAAGQLSEGAQPIPYDIQAQLDRLATYILEEIPGEPSQNEGAVDTAIRIMRSQQVQANCLWQIKELVEREFPAELVVADVVGWMTVNRVTTLLARYKRLRAALRARALQYGDPWKGFIEKLSDTPVGPLV